jgi:hypothetical protein
LFVLYQSVNRKNKGLQQNKETSYDHQAGSDLLDRSPL